MFSYEISDPAGRPVMETEHEKYRYPPKIESQMLSLGYKITVNGKRLTKKAARENSKTPRI